MSELKNLWLFFFFFKGDTLCKDLLSNSHQGSLSPLFTAFNSKVMFGQGDTTRTGVCALCDITRGWSQCVDRLTERKTLCTRAAAPTSTVWILLVHFATDNNAPVPHWLVLTLCLCAFQASYSRGASRLWFNLHLFLLERNTEESLPTSVSQPKCESSDEIRSEKWSTETQPEAKWPSADAVV